MLSAKNRVSLAATVLLAALVLLCGCGTGNNRADSDTTRKAEAKPAPFHADNDIAMVVRSLTDALAVGEKFDPKQYDFTGPLTDGSGAPLYIDSLDNPGEWKVKVLGPATATIYNTKSGDLVASDLAKYITSCLNLSDQNVVDANRTPEGEKVVYGLKRGYMRIESPGEQGLAGCRITVTVAAS